MGEIAPALVPSDQRQVEHAVGSNDVHESILVPISGRDISCRYGCGEWRQEAAAMVVAQ